MISFWIQFFTVACDPPQCAVMQWQAQWWISSRDLEWPSKSWSLLRGAAVLPLLPPRILQAHNSSKPIPISQTGSNTVSRVSGKVISMTRAGALNAWRLGLNSSRSQGKEKLKILSSSTSSSSSFLNKMPRFAELAYEHLQRSSAPPNKKLCRVRSESAFRV